MDAYSLLSFDSFYDEAELRVETIPAGTDDKLPQDFWDDKLPSGFWDDGPVVIAPTRPLISVLDPLAALSEIGNLKCPVLACPNVFLFRIIHTFLSHASLIHAP